MMEYWSRYFFLSLLLALVIHSTFSNENPASSQTNTQSSSVENLKILRKSVNFAYYCSKNFLNLIRGNKYPNTTIKQVKALIDDRKNVKLNDLIKTILPYIGYAVLLFLGIIFVIFMPIVGFCFCLCRCAGKCGGRIKGMDPRHAKCKRYIYALMLGIISVIMLAGLVLAFINNQLIHDSLTNDSEEINAVKQFQKGMDVIYKDSKNISTQIENEDKKGRPFEYEKINNADFFKKPANTYFEAVDESVSKLDVTGILNQFSQSIKTLTTAMVENNKKPSVTLQNVAEKIDGRVNTLKFSDAKLEVIKKLNESCNFAKLKNELKKELENSKISETFKSQADQLSSTSEHFTQKITEYKRMIKLEYLDQRMYIIIGICCLLLLIVLFYFLGLCFGQCGERPFEDARICNRGVGANLMMAGVAFAFLFTPTIMLIEMLLFNVGSGIQTEFCRYATKEIPNGPDILDMTFTQMNPEMEGVKTGNFPSLDTLLNKCRDKPFVYSVYRTPSEFSSSVKEEFNRIISSIEKTNFQNLVERYFNFIQANEIKEAIEKIRKESLQYTSSVRSNIQNQLTNVENKFNNFQTIQNDIIKYFKDHVAGNSISNKNGVNFRNSLMDEVSKVKYQIVVKKYENIYCHGVYNGTTTAVRAFCYTFLEPLNGFVVGIGICMVFTIPAIIFAVKLAGLYRRTEKYSSDYEEPDYNSYMGFYTNNAENIPMKRPKSGKSGQKNRNSNSNKDSNKQTNPQYLPVYPYEAYE